MMELKPYVHQVQYYETDKMGITHHANYIRWLEEARIDMMAQVGYPYDRLESEGIGIPVTGISFEYKQSTTFPDQVIIRPFVTMFNGVILEMRYEVTRLQDDKLIGTGTSKHTFLTKEGRFARLKRDNPEFYELLAGLVEE